MCRDYIHSVHFASSYLSTYFNKNSGNKHDFKSNCFKVKLSMLSYIEIIRALI